MAKKEKKKRFASRKCPICNGSGTIASNVDGLQSCHCGNGTIQVEITGPEFRVGDRVEVTLDNYKERGTVVVWGYCPSDEVTVKLPSDPEWWGPRNHDFSRVRLIRRARKTKKPT